MAVAIAGTLATGSINNGQNFNINMPAGIAAGNLVVVFVCGTAEANLGTSSSDWTTLGPWDSSNSTCRINLFWKIMPASPDASIAITGVGGATNSNCGIAVGFSGHDATTPIDTTPATTLNGSGNNPTPPAYTPLTNNSMMLIFVGDVSGTGDAAVTMPTTPSTFTAMGAVTVADNNDATAIGGRLLLSGQRDTLQTIGAFGSWTATVWNAITLGIRASGELPNANITRKVHHYKTMSPY